MESDLNNHHRDTLQRILSHPTSGNVEWREVLSLGNDLGRGTPVGPVDGGRPLFSQRPVPKMEGPGGDVAEDESAGDDHAHPVRRTAAPCPVSTGPDSGRSSNAVLGASADGVWK